jgi:uncharacterized protein YehS (DUF1456 family)
MENSEKIHTIAEVTSSLLTTIEIDGKEYPALKTSFDILTKVMPEIENVVQDIVAGKKPIESSSRLGVKIFSIVSADDGKIFKKVTPKSTDIKKIVTNPQALKTAAVSNPYVLLVVVALSIIEKDVKAVLAAAKDILSFLVAEKESEIEADVKTLSSIINKYTVNFDNERFITSNHKLVIDIQRTARKNMLFYEKRIAQIAKNNTIAVSQSNIEAYFKKLDKEFNYYKMAIYTFSLASFLEILLSSNFKEENINLTKTEIVEANESYTKYHNICLEKIKKLSHKSIESNTIKGSGAITTFIGKLFSKSKKEKDIETGKKLIAKGDELKGKSIDIENTYVNSFDAIKSTGSEVFIEKMEEMIFIYNHTGQICCDKDGIYLIKK